MTIAPVATAFCNGLTALWDAAPDRPVIDFSDIDEIRRTVEHCHRLRLPVPGRHPYAGDLVHTAYSGTHQDAVKKGLDRHARRSARTGVPAGLALWAVPYLPIDPADLGRDYEAVIRVNSQSGKGGIDYLLATHHGLDLPPALRAEFSRIVPGAADDTGGEISAKELWQLFESTYLAPGDGPLAVKDWQTVQTAPGVHDLTGARHGTGRPPAEVRGRGNGPLSALTAALAAAGVEVDILDYAEHATRSGPDSPAVAYARCRVGGSAVRWGAGRDTSVLTASVSAVLAAVNRG